MDLIRYQPNLRGLRQLRSSKEVDAHLEGRAHRVAAAAVELYDRVGHGDVPVEVVQEGSDTKAPRSRVAVIARHPAAIRIEAKYRVLGTALDAARG